jgi:hypothetical protein
MDVLTDCLSIGYDRTIEISTSKIKNRRATKKNWKENGRCDGFMLENPHSNWDHFSFLGTIFFCAIWVAPEKTATRIAVTKMIDVIFIFFFSY